MRISGGNFAARKAATCSLPLIAKKETENYRKKINGHLRTSTDIYGQLRTLKTDHDRKANP